MQEQGRFPWSRSKVADLVTKLTDAGVIVIAFDIFFYDFTPIKFFRKV